MSRFDGIRKNIHLGVEAISRKKVIVKMRKLKNDKLAGIDGITGEMVKYGGEIMIDRLFKEFVEYISTLI